MKHQQAAESLPENAKTRILLTIIALTLLVALLGGLYLRYAWNRYQQMAASETLQLARSIESLLHVDHIAALAADNPLQTTSANLTEQALVRLVEATDAIYYAYILKQQGERILVIADSAAADSATSNPNKLSCEETAEINRLPFETGRSLLTKPITAPCGNWIRALVPIYDAEGKTVIAVLGLSYSTSEWQANLWKRMIPDFSIVSCLLTLACMLFSLLRKHSTLQKTTTALAFQEALYRNVFEQAPIGIILQEGKDKQAKPKYLSVNPMGEAILGRMTDELRNTPWLELTHAEDRAAELPQFERFANGEISSYSVEKRIIKPDGSIVWVNFKATDFSAAPLYNSMYLCLLEDITDRKKSEESLRESERSKSVFFSHLPGMAYRCKYDQSWTMEFVSEGCYALTGYDPESLTANRKISYNEIIAPEYRAAVRTDREKALLKHEHYHHEYEIITKSGDRKWVIARGRGICDANGVVEALEGIVFDISEQKKKEHQIAYLRERDFLTGLYNRNRMEQEKRRLDRPEFWPLSVTICDIDGLRMINDAYGHEEGDRLIVKAASLIQGCLPGEYVLGHAGGGEFILLLPQTDNPTAQRVKANIESAIYCYNRANENALYAISVSIGYGTKETEDQPLQDVTRAAEEYLKSRKLLNQNSSHSAIVSSIMATLYAKSQETEKHGQRLGQFCQIIGERLGLEQKDLDDLQLVSKLHDIGKIGIDDRILNKPGKLSEDEWKIMKQHPEIGHRIAISTPQLEHIANYILHHHERWDGSGYPMGLAGENIPIVSRILSIADAFDAMTEDRSYRKALLRETAIWELERNAGTQFDPAITRLFIALIEQQGHLEFCGATRND